MTLLTNAKSSAPRLAQEIRSFTVTLCSLAKSGLCAATLLLATTNSLLAQTPAAGSKLDPARKTATLQEASGTTVREFDALKALRNDFNDETPRDENALWIPDMALAKKPTASQQAGARKITFQDGKVRSEAPKATSNQQVTNRQATTRQTPSQQANQPATRSTQRAANSAVASANYQESRRNATTARQIDAAVRPRANAGQNILQTQALVPNNAGFADYAVAAPAPTTAGSGFGDYQGVSEPPLVALRESEPVDVPAVATQQPVGANDAPALDAFPAVGELPELEPFPSNDDFLPIPAASEAPAVNVEATPEPANAPATNDEFESLVDAPFPTVDFPDASGALLDAPVANQVESTVNAAVNADYPAPAIDANQNPGAAPASPELGTLEFAPAIQEETAPIAASAPATAPVVSPAPVVAPAPAVSPTPVVAPAPAPAVAPSVDVPLVASRPSETPIVGQNASNQIYAGDLLAPETEIDSTVIGGADEPYRESFRATPKKEYTTQTYLEKNLLNPEPKSTQTVDEAQLSEEDKKNLVIEDVRISGLEMTTQQFNKIVRTRIGAKFNQQRLEEDKRALLQTKQFIDVDVSTSYSPDNPGKVVVNFDLTPRRMMRYVKVVGNQLISKHDILEELGMHPGESRMDPYEVENGRIRIIEFYKSKEYAEPYVEILKGDHPEDVGVVYLIDEGRKQRVLKTSFIGNSAVSEARLKSLVSVKPGVLYLIGGKFTREKLDYDVQKLLEYYRNLGFFDARIDREYEERSWFGGLGKDNAWVAVRYVIDEGPRYRIRNFIFNGNRVVPTKDLEAKLKVKRGQYYLFDEIEADRIALRYKYQDLGYVRADITPNQVFTDEVGVVDIRYDIVEDHKYRVNDVIVKYSAGKGQKTADARTKVPVVLSLLDISPGELLDGKKIRMSENTLRQSGHFNDDPAQGQLPEIAVVPNMSKSYVLEKHGDANYVKETRKGSEEKDDDVEKTTRGQSESQGRDATRITRGQEPVDDSYVPYDQAKRRVASQQTRGEGKAFLSYAPRLAANAPQNAANIAQTPRLPENASDARAQNAAQNADVKSVANAGEWWAPWSWDRAGLNYYSTVRGQSRSIPSGFSSVSSRGNSEQNYDYSPYDSASNNAASQYDSNLDYANYESANLLNSNAVVDRNYGANSYVSSDDVDSTPGFSDGVYSSIGKDILEPVTPETDEIYDGDVLVNVQEGRTGMFQASIGVNSDYGLVGNVSFTERNFDILRFPTALCRADGWKDAFRGGGQIFSVQASPGTNVQSYRVSWDVPNVFYSKYLFGVTGLYGEHSFDEWFEARYGGEIRLGRQWTNRFSTTVNLGMYNVKIKDPAVGFVPDLNEVVRVNRLYNIGLTAAYDTRNHPYSPSAGYLLKGTVEEGLGDYQFPRVTLDARYYRTLRKRVDGTGRWVLGLSSRAGWTGDKTPIFERYFGGGASNLRGFEYREVTPRYKESGFGIGGKFEFYNTAELYIPVSGGDAFQFVVFCDTGVVSESIKKWGRYRVAPGVGLRFNIPMLGPAPLALDFAFPVSKDPNDVTQVFTFNLSGSR